mgnify:CR=1 FL=1
MRNTKIISSSLNRKIIENEKKMESLKTTKEQKAKSKSLYNISNDESKSKRKKDKMHKINKSQEEIITRNSNKPKKLKLQYSTIQTVDYSDDSFNIINNKLDKRLKSYSKISNKNEKILFNNTISNIYTKNFNFDKTLNSKKVNPKELDVIINRLYTNEHKTRKKIENEKNNSNTIDYNSSTSKKTKVNFNEIYSRFEDDIKKREENLERKREEINNNNKTIYTYKPKLNISKKFFDNQNNENFLERQKKYYEEKKKKEERYKEDLVKKQNEELEKNNILSKNVVKNKKEIEKSINELNEWDTKRKKKIDQKLKEKMSKIQNEFNYMPKINKKSEILAKNNKQRQKETNVFNRLAKEDKVLKEKQKILIQLYTPSFKPNIVATKKINYKKLNSSKEKEFDTVSKRWKPEEYLDNSNSDSEDEKNDDDFKGDYIYDDNYDNNIYTEENIQNAYRKALFHKNKK